MHFSNYMVSGRSSDTSCTIIDAKVATYQRHFKDKQDMNKISILLGLIMHYTKRESTAILIAATVWMTSTFSNSIMNTRDIFLKCSDNSSTGEINI